MQWGTNDLPGFPDDDLPPEADGTASGGLYLPQRRPRRRIDTIALRVVRFWSVPGAEADPASPSGDPGGGTAR
jgi:hypothetical protein